MNIFIKLSSAILVVMILASCGKQEDPASKQAPQPDKPSEAEVVADLVAQLENLRPGEVAGPLLDDFDATLQKLPEDPAVREILLKGGKLLEKILWEVFLLTKSEDTIEDVAKSLEERLSRLHAVAKKDSESAQFFEKALARVRSIKDGNSPLVAWRAYAAMEGEQPPWAGAFGTRAVGSWARRIVENRSSVAGLTELGCPECVGLGPSLAVYEKKLTEGGLGCGGDKPTLGGLKGCMLPEGLKALPPSIDGRLSPLSAARSLAWSQLVTLVAGRDLGERYQFMAAEARKTIDAIQVPVYPGVMSPLVEGTEGSEGLLQTALSKGLAFAGAPALIHVEQGMLVVSKPAQIRSEGEKVSWVGGERVEIALKALLVAEVDKKEALVLAAKKQLVDALGLDGEVPGEVHLVADLRTSAKEFSALTEILELAGVSTRGLVTSDLGILPAWLTDTEKVPEDFPEKRLKARVTRKGINLELSSGNAFDKDLAASAPEGVEVKLIGTKSEGRVRVSMAAEKFELGLAWAVEKYGDYDAVWVDARGADSAMWQKVVAATTVGANKPHTLTWMGDTLAKVEGEVNILPVALQLRTRPSQKKKVPAAPKKPAKKLGYCAEADIKRAMKTRNNAFKSCYERELQMHRDLAGKVTIRFVIGDDGKVVSGKAVVNAIKSRSIAPCLIKNIKKLRFTKPAGGQCEVNWPFKFQPGG